MYYAYRCTKHCVSSSPLTFWRPNKRMNERPPNARRTYFVIAHAQHSQQPRRERWEKNPKNNTKPYLFIKCTNIRLFHYTIYCCTSDEFCHCSDPALPIYQSFKPYPIDSYLSLAPHNSLRHQQNFRRFPICSKFEWINVIPHIYISHSSFYGRSILYHA